MQRFLTFNKTRQPYHESHVLTALDDNLDIYLLNFRMSAWKALSAEHVRREDKKER